MRFSAKAEYACIAMLELAVNHTEPQPVRVKNIADAHGIPLRFLVQILLQLKGAGLVTSVRGAAGGYQLARPPAEISLADIINVIDRIPKNRTPSESMPTSPAARAIQKVWSDIQAAEQRLLAEATLAELVQQIDESALSSYQI